MLSGAATDSSRDFGLLTYAENDSAPAERLSRLAIGNVRESYEQRCEIALSRLRRADTTGARRTAAGLRTTGVANYDEAPVCASLIEGIVVALAQNSPRATRVRALVTVDSLLKTQPMGTPSIWNYDVAVAFARLGEFHAAASAVNRRLLPRSARLAISLRDEGIWALQAGDTTAALTAFKRYLLFRDKPEPSLQSQTTRVKAMVARLEAAKQPR